MTEAKHSKYSASAAKRWMNCPGSMVLCVGLVDHGSKYADEGTKAHAASEELLTTGAISTVTGVDGDMLKHVGVYTGNIKQYAEGGTLMVEQRVNYSRFLGVDTGEAWGTSDAIVIQGNEVQVHDLKYGQGELVSAENNEQMMLYALGALDALDDLAGPFTHFRTAIHQVRVDPRPQEWDGTVETLLAFGEVAKRAVHAVKAAEFGFQSVADGTKTQAEWEAEYLNPGEGQCRWCKAKATCPKLRSEVAEQVLGMSPATPEDFADVAVGNIADHIAVTDNAWLSASMGKANLIEMWLKAIRAEVERRLLAGGEIDGYKLVMGRAGNRVWANAAEAEKLLKSFRLKEAEMYDFKLISPTTAEEVLKESPKRWAKAKELITRSEGSKSVAPVSDKREAIVVRPTADEFDDVITVHAGETVVITSSIESDIG